MANWLANTGKGMGMKVLVINVGSTSIKYDLYEMDTETVLAGGTVERVGSPEAKHRWRVGTASGDEAIAAETHRAGLDAVLARLTGPGGAIKEVSEVRAVGPNREADRATFKGGPALGRFDQADRFLDPAHFHIIDDAPVET